jgi:putative lipoic acid-binding regulatory protein
VLNSSGAVVQTVQKIKPEQRTEAITTTLAKGNYTVKLTLTDIFNNDTAPVEIPITVN